MEVIEEQPRQRRHAFLLASIFEGRSPVFVFPYTAACGAPQRNLERAIQVEAEAPRMCYCHSDRVHQYNAVKNVMRQGGFHPVRPESSHWTLLWSKQTTAETIRAMQGSQRTNHFVGSRHLGRKDLLWRRILSMQRPFGREFDITPPGYVLPKAWDAWRETCRQRPETLWIWKPCGQSCGRGIRVLSSQISERDEETLRQKKGIAQEYVDRPLLIDGYKFDLRVYVVVTSFDPLKIYVNDEGLVRLATEKYSLSAETLGKRTMHLTNYSVNKASPAFVQNRDGCRDVESDEGCPHDEDLGAQASKWSFAELRAHFERQRLDFEGTFDRIKDLVVKTLVAVEPAMRADWARAVGEEGEGWAARGPGGACRSSCFEIYGFDVIIDADLKPWLLEVNVCPSFSSGSPLDKRIKTKLVADVFTLLGLRPPARWARETAAVLPVPQEDAGVTMLRADELDARAEALDECETLEDAIASFDDVAWELVLSAAEEESRRGGLECVFPTSRAAEYARFLDQESYCNMVLRIWHEAGGHDLFRTAESSHLLPPWLPRRVSTLTT